MSDANSRQEFEAYFVKEFGARFPEDAEQYAHEWREWQAAWQAARQSAPPQTPAPVSTGADAKDAVRFEWMLNEPEGAQHLLNLLKQGKGSKESFRTMIDRIKAPKDAAMSDEAGKV